MKERIAVVTLCLCACAFAHGQGMLITSTFYEVYAAADVGNANGAYSDTQAPWPSSAFFDAQTADDNETPLVAHGDSSASGFYSGTASSCYGFSMASAGNASVTPEAQANGGFAEGYGFVQLYFTTLTPGTLVLSGVADPAGADGSLYAARVRNESNGGVALFDSGAAGGSFGMTLHLAAGSYEAEVYSDAFAADVSLSSGGAQLDATYTAVPEPFTLTLGLAAVALGICRRRRSN